MIFFKKALVLFWMFWWLMILWNNSVSVAAHLGLLHATWAPDKYILFVDAILNLYHVSVVLPAFLYIGIMVWVFVIIILFFLASLSINKDTKIWLGRSNSAFIVALLLWLAFIIADQIIIRYDIGQLHMIQGGFQLLTFFALHLLPNK